MIFEFWELESPAFTRLSADATRVYLLMRKRLSFDHSNNGAVPFSHRDAAEALRAGGWRRGSNALAELEYYGFIKCRKSGEPGPNIRPASEWQLTAFPCGGQKASKTFMSWQGEAFDPPYRSSTTRPKKQLPIGNMQTQRRQHEDAHREPEVLPPAENGQSVSNMKTLRSGTRRHHEDTITITTQGGLESIHRALCELRYWSTPRLMDVPRGPAAAHFGGWLRAQRLARGVEAQFLADTLDVSPEELDEMEIGTVQMSARQRRRAESTRSPLYAGARALLERGHDPEQLMTIRLGRRQYDSFVPVPIGELAKWTIEESDQRGLSRREWRPFSGRFAQDGHGTSTTSPRREAAREASERRRPEFLSSVEEAAYPVMLTACRRSGD